MNSAITGQVKEDLGLQIQPCCDQCLAWADLSPRRCCRKRRELLEARDYESLRARGGIAPVTRRSGKRGVVVMRRSCNRRLRYALYHWARSSVRIEERSRASYETLRQRGRSHGRALRSVADQCLRMLMAIPEDGDALR